jgi:hypothetical protein
MPEVDLDKVDASWDDDEPEPSGPDVNALDAGWDTPRARKNAADKAAARKDKARARKERQRARAEEATQKQKKKQKKPRPSRDVEGAPRSTSGPAELTEAGSLRPPRPLSRRKRAARHSWGLTLIAIAIIIAVAAFVLFVVRR